MTIRANSLNQLPELLSQLGAKRILVLSGPSRRYVERVIGMLRSQTVEVFDQAAVHVPAETVAAAQKHLASMGADTIISVGGGSSTGLGKALRLANDVRFIAVPTTYAGSEMTSIYGVSADGEKSTGRDVRVRPDAVIHDADLTRDMPLVLTTTSLVNALAHPISVMSTSPSDEALLSLARRAIGDLTEAIEQLTESPDRRSSRSLALAGAATAAGVLELGELGAHHRMAHLLGGRFGIDHAALHSVLLPQSIAAIRSTQWQVYEDIVGAAGFADLSAVIFDFLRRAGAATSLSALGVAADDMTALVESTDLDSEVLWSAFHGRRPSRYVRRQRWGFKRPVAVSGPEPEDAHRVVIALHGRNSNADAIVQRAIEIAGNAPDVCYIAPQAFDNAWYSKSYRESAAIHGVALARALDVVDRTVRRVLESVDSSKVVLFGFSQGACLVVEYLARHPRPIAGLVAICGARIGLPIEQLPMDVVEGLPVLLGTASDDHWVDTADVERTATQFTEAGANVVYLPTTGDAHEMAGVHRMQARSILTGRTPAAELRGFGNVSESESLVGALPTAQNSPRNPRYGLYPEQINGTGFVARRHENLRTWVYRIRPSAQRTPFQPLAHHTFVADFSDTPPDPNLVGFRPIPSPAEPTDFVDGMMTVGGAGRPSLRRGYALHVYVANRSMENRAFYNSDGDLLLIPQDGALTLMTEMGRLDVAPGEIAILPRGILFSVLLRTPEARGYVGEIYGRHFELPERGPVGANALTEPRHFRAPAAWHEDRLHVGYRISSKSAGALFDARQDYSPYDVVAWHGNYTPYVYDLRMFAPVSNVRIDHPDPSIFTVLSAAQDEPGANTLDFVFFPPRWDVGEGTFRPPFFHRNAVTEFNGIIRDSSGDHDPFWAGGFFVTPAMTPHGIRAHAVERVLQQRDEVADRPRRTSDKSMWFQFESALPFSYSRWAMSSSSRIDDWHSMWGAYRNHFDPTDGGER